ncbi:hypothetical protein KQI84_10565 [bacterium]|nr:hypothetical protein [bacterium]
MVTNASSSRVVLPPIALLILLLGFLPDRTQAQPFTQLQFGESDKAILADITSFDSYLGTTFKGSISWSDALENVPVTLEVTHSGVASDPGKVFSGSVPFDLPQPYKSPSGNWAWYTTKATLSSLGARADFELQLPEGVIVKRRLTDPLFREEKLPFGFGNFDQELRYLGIRNFAAEELDVLKLENDPFWLLTNGNAWFTDVDGLQIPLGANDVRYVFKDEFDKSPGTRPANGGWMYYATPVNNLAVVHPDGLQLLIEDYTAENHLPGFPQGVVAGTVSFEVSFLNSQLTTGTVTSAGGLLSYGGEICTDPNAVTPQFFGPSELEVGPDGAILGTIDNSAAAPMEFPFDAYEVGPLEEDASLYFPGWKTSGASLNALPTEYLLAGRTDSADDDAALVMSGEEEYAEGDGSYAGYTLGRTAMSGVSFSVDLACNSAPFTSSNGGSKIYVRKGGISGTLDASEAAVAALPPLMLFNEYETVLTKFNNTFLDNHQHLDSEINGAIILPFPSDTQLSFTNLELEPCGLPGAAQLADVTDNVLAYWNRTFDFSSLEFVDVSPPESICGGTPKRTLKTTSTNTIPELGVALLAETEFAGNGDIRDVELLGEPANDLQEFTFTVRSAYYSAWDGTNNLNGLTVVRGDIKLPFWGATPVTALWDIGATPRLFDGRKAAETPPVDIDPDHNGFPAGISSIQEYTDSPTQRPVVSSSFAGIVDLEYPVAYNNVARRFATAPGEEKDRDLVVLSVASSVRGITRDDTEIVFGAGYQGFPAINLSSLLDDFTDPVLQELLGPLKDGMGDLNEALSGNFGEAIRSSMADVTRPIVTDLVNQLRDVGDQAEGASADLAAMNARIDTVMADLDTYLATEYAKGTGPLVMQIDRMLSALENIEAKINNLNIDQLHQVLAALVDLAGAEPDGIDQVFGDVEEARAYIVDNLINGQLKPQLEELRNQIGEGAELANLQEIDNLISGGDFTAMVATVKQGLKDMANEIHSNAATVRNLDPEVVNQLVVDTIYNTAFFQAVNQVVAQVFEPLRMQVQEILNGLFDTLNNQVKAYLDIAGSAINDVTQQLNDVVGVSAAEISGYAVFGGQTLDRLHIDAEFAFEFSDSFEFRASLDMERHKNDSDKPVCGTPVGAESIKVEIAVFDVPLRVPRGDLKAEEIQVMLRLNQDGPDLPFFLSDMGGKIETSGAIDFEAVRIVAPFFAMAVGLNEIYVTFKGGVVFEGGSAQGGIFLGKTCNGIELLTTLDPEVEGAFKEDEITGIYSFAEAVIPVWDNGCFLRLSANVGAGFWFLLDGPSFGGKLTAGVVGKAICLVSAKGKMTLIGGKEDGGYFLKGIAWLGGGLGFCEPEAWFEPKDVLNDKWCASCVMYADVLYRTLNFWSFNLDADCSL